MKKKMNRRLAVWHRIIDLPIGVLFVVLTVGGQEHVLDSQILHSLPQTKKMIVMLRDVGTMLNEFRAVSIPKLIHQNGLMMYILPLHVLAM